MKKIEKFQIVSMSISGFKSYQSETTLDFGNLTLVTGGNGRGKTSIADAIAFAITGLPFFGKRGIDRLYNEVNPDVCISLRFLDETQTEHILTRTRHKDRMNIVYDGIEIRQVDLTDMFGDRDVFLAIFNPLYFIEELGDSGKNLLERCLPPVAHEEIMQQLSEDTQNALAGEQLLSPEGRIKKLREEIREQKDTVIYLTGQKDQAFMQQREQQQKLQELSERKAALTQETAGLETKQFDEMDKEQLRERLVELSSRYEELAKDGNTEAEEHRNHLQALQEKIAQCKAQQYASKFAQAIADVQAQINELGARYKQELKNAQSITQQSACPTCHRPLAGEALTEVQTAIQTAVDELLALGKQRREELNELQNLDSQSKAVFEQNREDDLKKWIGEAAELEQSIQQSTGDTAGEIESLRAEIQAVTTDLEYGNLSQEELDRLKECREKLGQCDADLTALQNIAVQSQEVYNRQIADTQEHITDLEKKVNYIALYLSKRAELLVSQLHMNKVQFSLFDVVKTTGEIKDTFKFTYDGRSYDRLSLSEKIRAGMEVSELMKRLTGRNYPVFIDNMESVDDLANVQPTGQVIMAKCVHGADLSVQPAGKPAQKIQPADIPTAA